MPVIVLIRHGETEWSRAGQHTGLTDVPLTKVGEQQARALVPYLRRHSFALVLTSPLQRAKQTCELAGLGDRAVVDDDLREWDYGDDEGRTTAEIRTERPGWTVFDNGPSGGETADQVSARIDRVLARARTALADGDVALFAHGHLLRALGARWVELSVTDGKRFTLAAAAVSELAYEREQPVLQLWNLQVTTDS